MFLFLLGFRNHGLLGLCEFLRSVSSCQRDPTKKKRSIRKGSKIKKHTYTRLNLPISLKVQFRHVQASIPRTYKKKRKGSVRKGSQIKQTHIHSLELTNIP